MSKPKAVWHYHHGVLLEFPEETIEKRNAFNRKEKPKRQLARREKLIRYVKGKLPAAFIKAQSAYDKAWAAYKKHETNKTWDGFCAAQDAYARAYVDNMPALLTLHAKECGSDCPWDGETIFPKRKP